MQHGFFKVSQIAVMKNNAGIRMLKYDILFGFI